MNIFQKDIAAIVVLCLAFVFAIIMLWPRDPKPKHKPDKCTFDPATYDGPAQGMFHCPECGEMVLAGLPHPDPDLYQWQGWHDE